MMGSEVRIFYPAPFSLTKTTSYNKVWFFIFASLSRGHLRDTSAQTTGGDWFSRPLGHFCSPRSSNSGSSQWRHAIWLTWLPGALATSSETNHFRQKWVRRGWSLRGGKLSFREYSHTGACHARASSKRLFLKFSGKTAGSAKYLIRILEMHDNY